MTPESTDTIIAALQIKSVAYFGILLLIYWLLRSRSATSQSYLLRAAFVGTLVMGGLGLGKPIWHINVTERATPARSVIADRSLQVATVPISGAMSDSGNEAVGDSPETGPAATLIGKDLMPSGLLLLWGAGAVACFSRFIIGWIQVVRLRSAPETGDTMLHRILANMNVKLRRRRDVQVRMHDRLSSPASFGTFRPVIVLPKDYAKWEDEDLRMVLQHELAHIQRYDSAFLWLAEFCRALFWMNPLVWIAVKQMRLADERVADDVVLQSGHRVQEYAQLLLAFARKSVGSAMAPLPSASSAMAQASTVRVRVERILDASQRRGCRKHTSLFSVGFICSVFAALIGGATAIAQDEVTEKDESAGSFIHVPNGGRVDDPVQGIIEKLRHTVIPELKFQDATLQEVVSFLRTKSQELGSVQSEADKNGINFIVSAKTDKRITLDLQDVPMIIALRSATELAGVRYRLEPFAVVIVSQDDDAGPLFSRVFQVTPTFMSDSGLGKDATASEYLEILGVTFPDGARAHFVPSNSQLAVRNTPNNLDKIQTIIEQSMGQVLTTMAVSVEIYALSKKEALKLVSEHRNKSDVTDVVKKLQEQVNGETVKLVASPHFITRRGLRASIESGQKIEYVSGYIEKDGRDVAVNRSSFAGTRVEVVPVLGSDGFTIDASIQIIEGLGEPRIEKSKVIAPVSGREVEVSSVRIDELTLNTVTTVMAGQTKLVGVMSPPAHLERDEAHIVFLKIDRVAAWEPEKNSTN